MPRLDKKITDGLARALETPPFKNGRSIYEMYWCPVEPGFGLRISSTGDKAWIYQGLHNRKEFRRTLGKTKVLSREAAVILKRGISAELQQGLDRATERRQAAKAERETAITLEQAIDEYIKGKRRAKDGLPLKERTKNDYLNMVRAATYGEDGSVKKIEGLLYCLAEKSIFKIDADDIRATYKSACIRGTRQADYAMQVLRAVLNWHGVNIDQNPLSRATAGKKRIHIAQTKATGKTIPPERIGIWWKAAINRENTPAVDYLKFLLLTGCRPGEPLKVLVRDVDLIGGRVLICDTKNRRDHVVLLSRQALEIVERNAIGKRPTLPLFSIVDCKKTMMAIGRETDIEYSQKTLRATFASVAEQLCSYATLKRLMNHTDTGDVTANNYIRVGEVQLRAGWQAVADWIEEQAGAR